ncbi:SDR family oxidoreductase [Caldibacillus lycopersici]|uniref:SDR family oxidoreductase n=1 Tax=Perspicuibacillus lycopersici TaxID=1325689 RepID=A0AAE3IQC5_9BACI|nr:SDR family oxidoreductase [Perspicuibacillus lycopersici]MCU9612623.1 SDR family oxidoreductase [Perspicuibacillus lycopersici]
MKLLVTGANRGLGFYLVKVGLEKGYHIFAGVRNSTPDAMKSLEDLKNTFGANLTIVKLDVTDEASVIRASQQVMTETANLDVIINNAGVLFGRNRTIEEVDIEECMKTMDINTFGSLRVLKHFLPFVRKGKNQSIINISSDSGSLTNAYSGDYAYGLSKAALNMLSEKLHIYLKNDSIRVYSIHPGWMRTDMGGQQASLDPIVSANGIFQIIESRPVIASKYVFIDYKGQPMEI